MSHVPKKGKVVLVLSTMHHDDRIDVSTGEKAKPEIITFYNSTKCGVDVVDKLSASYNVARNTRRWSMTVFFALMNVVGINAKIIYKANSKEQCIRRKFLKNLSLQLVKGRIQKRQQFSNLPRELASKVKRSCSETARMGEPAARKSTSLRRCYYCPRGKDRKSRYGCLKCNVCLCMEHINFMCQQFADMVVEEEM